MIVFKLEVMVCTCDGTSHKLSEWGTHNLLACLEKLSVGSRICLEGNVCEGSMLLHVPIIIAKYNSIVWISYNLFIYSPVDGHVLWSVFGHYKAGNIHI